MIRAQDKWIILAGRRLIDNQHLQQGSFYWREVAKGRMQREKWYKQTANAQVGDSVQNSESKIVDSIWVIRREKSCLFHWMGDNVANRSRKCVGRGGQKMSISVVVFEMWWRIQAEVSMNQRAGGRVKVCVSFVCKWDGNQPLKPERSKRLNINSQINYSGWISSSPRVFKPAASIL